METKQHPPPQSPLVVANMHNERLQPPPQSSEFTPQQQHHQDYGNNSLFFSASREDFMSNLIDLDLQTPKSAYVYMQSMLVHSFGSFHQTIISNSSTNQPNFSERETCCY